MTSRDLSKVLRENVRSYGMYIALVVIILIFTITTHGLFISSRNISTSSTRPATSRSSPSA